MKTPKLGWFSLLRGLVFHAAKNSRMISLHQRTKRQNIVKYVYSASFSCFSKQLLLKTANCTNSTLVQGTIETFFIHNTSIGSLIWEKPRVKQKSCSPESISDGYNACQRSYERKILGLPSWNSQFPSKQVHQFDSIPGCKNLVTGKDFLKLCVTCNDRLRTENKAYCLRLRDPSNVQFKNLQLLRQNSINNYE